MRLLRAASQPNKKTMNADDLIMHLNERRRPAKKAAFAARALATAPHNDEIAQVILNHLAAFVPLQDHSGDAAEPFLALIAEAERHGRPRVAEALAILLRFRVKPKRGDGIVAQIMRDARLPAIDNAPIVGAIGRAAGLTGQDALKQRARCRYATLRPYWRDPKSGDGVVRALILNRLPNLMADQPQYVFNHSNLPLGYAEEGTHPRLALDVLMLLGADPGGVIDRIERPSVVINNIGGGEVLKREGLSPLIEDIARRLGAPLINPPGAVIDAGREENYRRIGETEHLIFPKTIGLPPGFDPAAAANAARDAFDGPVIVRDMFSHMGARMRLVADPAELEGALAPHVQSGCYAIAYHDYPQRDGLYYRYRMYRVGDHITPSRIHVSEGWNVHGKEHDALKETRPELKLAELEVRFWERPTELVPEPVWNALAAMLRESGLDYCGCDFTMAPDGRAFIFEMNSAMHMKLKGREAFERLVGLT